MKRAVIAAVTLAVTSVSAPGHATASGVGPAAAPTHTLTVSGTDVAMYPAFRPDLARYAVTTSDATAGSVTVSAATSDTAGVVRVNGRVAPGGQTTVTGLTPGDEISVIIEDSGGREVHSLFYLPAGFPRLEVTTDQPGVAPGDALVTMSKWSAPGPVFEAALDRNGVPAYVRTGDSPIDLKKQPNGSFTVSRTPATPGKSGRAVVELDSSFRPTGRTFETIGGRVDTDGHDSVLLADGTQVLIGYEHNATTDLVDAVIQMIRPDGSLALDWSTADHVDPAAEATYDYANDTGFGKGDYAHINSVQVVDDGQDILASFRHLSSVFKIAAVAHDGYAKGDIIWHLGGRRSDFTFVDDPYPGGPCAQHTARELPNGHILMFDNGSGRFGGLMCVDPADPTGPSIARAQTRVTEYALDPESHTATLVWSWEDPGRFGYFAGSAQRLAGGNTFVGWAHEARDHAIATEVAPDGSVVWQLADPAGASGDPYYSAYRALKYDVPDTIDPVLDPAGLPAEGESYAFDTPVSVDFGCTDRGGSDLVVCGEAVRPGDRLDTSTVGDHTLTVTAVDGAGNTASVTRHYTVAPLDFTSSPTPTVSGTPVFGSQLRAVPGTWLPQPSSFSYQWKRDGTPIPGATDRTYPLGLDDIGHRMAVTVTGSRTGYRTVARTSARTATVAPAVFSTTTRPTVRGGRHAGELVTAHPGKWTPEPSSFSYRWLRDGVPISRATDPTYRLRRRDRGHDIAVKVTARREGYRPRSRTSATIRVR